MKYYLDEDLSQTIARILRERGIEATSAHEEGTEEWDDEDLLAQAGQGGFCFVTRNRNDFIDLTVIFYCDVRPHAGVLVVPYTYPGDRFSLVAAALAEYASTHPDGMLPYTIDFLPPPSGPRPKTRRKRSSS